MATGPRAAESSIPIRQTSKMFDPIPDKTTLCTLANFAWSDHFQTREQTWKSLQNQILISAAIIGLNLTVIYPGIRMGAALLLIALAVCGIKIAFHHREVERKCFRVISEIERLLGMREDFMREQFSELPELGWKQLLTFSARGTAAYICYVQVVIILAALTYIAGQGWQLLR